MRRIAGILTLSFLILAPVAVADEDGAGRTCSEAEAWALGWPAMAGPFGNFLSARTRARIVDDLREARLVWESGDRDFGRAKHSTGTFKRAGSVAKRRVVIQDGRVYYVSNGPDKNEDRYFFIADEETGKILAEQGGGNNTRGYVSLVEDRLFVAPDWAHGGRAMFDLHTADPADFRRICTDWKPARPMTTAYTVFLEIPAVAGRVYLRTEAGAVLCYDLRRER